MSRRFTTDINALISQAQTRVREESEMLHTVNLQKPVGVGNLEIDLHKETAKSICETLLARSMPKCKIVGAYESASSEVVVKVNTAKLQTLHANKTAIVIEINADVSNAKGEVQNDEKPYLDRKWPSKKYLGIKTSLGSSTSVSSEELGPIIAKPVRASANLYALDRIAGGDGEGPKEFFKKLFGTDLPEPELISPLLSTGYEPRAMASVNKRHHAVFGHENDGPIFTVNMDAYNRDAFGKHAAADWGRFINAARYYAIVNSFYDPVLGPQVIAAKLKLTVAPPRHSVNIIPPESLKFPDLNYENISTSSIFETAIRAADEKLNIDHLASMISEHIEIFDKVGTDDPSYDDAYMRAAKEFMLVSRIRGRKRASTQRKIVGIPELSDVNVEPMSYEEKLKIAQGHTASSPFDACVEVMSKYIEKVQMKVINYKRLITGEINILKDDLSLDGRIRDVNKKIMRNVWVRSRPDNFIDLAVAEFSKAQPRKEAAVKTMLSYLSRIANSPINAASTRAIVPLDVAAERGEIKIIQLIDHAVKKDIRVLIKAPIMPTGKDVIQVASSIKTSVRKRIISFMQFWGEHYQGNADKFIHMMQREESEEHKKVLKNEAIKWQCLSAAFKRTDPDDLKHGAFTDWEKVCLDDTFLGDVVKTFLRKRKWKIDFNFKQEYPYLYDAVVDLDSKMPEKLEVPFSDIAILVSDKFMMITSDIEALVENPDKARELIMRGDKSVDEVLADINKPKEGLLDEADIPDELAAMLAAMEAMDFDTPMTFETSEGDMESTWEDKVELDYVLKQRGFKTFSEMFDAEKDYAGKDAYLMKYPMTRLKPEMPDEGKEVVDLV